MKNNITSTRDNALAMAKEFYSLIDSTACQGNIMEEITGMLRGDTEHCMHLNFQYVCFHLLAVLASKKDTAQEIEASLGDRSYQHLIEMLTSLHSFFGYLSTPNGEAEIHLYQLAHNCTLDETRLKKMVVTYQQNLAGLQAKIETRAAGIK